MEVHPDSNKYDPLQDMPYMNERHLAYFKEILEDWRLKVQVECEDLENHLHELQTGSEYDDIDKAFVETEITFTVSKIQGYLDLLNEIEASIEDIENNRYGYCRKTGEEIGLKRLLAQPTSKFSVQAQIESEQSAKNDRFDDNSNYMLENIGD